MKNSAINEQYSKALPGSYFWVQDILTKKIIRIEAETLTPDAAIKYMTKQPAYFPFLDETFEEFKDYIINNHVSNPNLPQVRILRLDLEKVITPDTDELKNFVCNEYIPELLSKGITPIADINVSEYISPNTYHEILPITEVSHRDGYPIYTSLESMNACLYAGEEIRKKWENMPENFFCYYDKENPKATPKDIIDKIYFNDRISDVEYPEFSLGIDLSKMDNWNKTSLKDFLSDYLKVLGLSQGPYIALLWEGWLHVKASNITWFNDTPLQVQSNLNPYQLEELYISLKHKYNLDFYNKTSKPTNEELQKIKEIVKGFLSTTEPNQQPKNNKSLSR